MRRCYSLLNTKGVDFLKNRFTNKGTAFTLEERDALGVRGLLPPQEETIHDQMDRYYTQFQLLNYPINKYQLLRGIMDTNITLYYSLLSRNLKEMLPIIYTPTVGEACQKYGALYQRDHGVYVSSTDAGQVRNILSNSRKKEVHVIVVTDGSRILGLGDLGANGMGISIGKCSLYVAGAGVHPGKVLPVMIDCGTNNEQLKNDPLYLGQRVSRVDDATFFSLMDEFMDSVKSLWPSATIQFEDFSNNHCFDMLERYQKNYRCFNDDIQGTGAVVSAGFLNAIQLSGTDPKDHRILVFGAGSAAVGVVSNIAELCALKYQLTTKDILDQVFLVDTQGLVTASRPGKLQKHKVPFARKEVTVEQNLGLKDLFDIIKFVKPTAILGLGGSGPVFTEDMIKFMMTYCERPIVFPLSNPSSKAEIIPSDAYKWSNGKAIVASGSPFPECIVDGKLCRPSQGNNMYIFPGVGLGCSLAQPKYIPSEVLLEAAMKLSGMVSSTKLEADGGLYPPIDEIRNVSKHIAVSVIQKIQSLKLDTAKLPTNGPDLLKLIDRSMWTPQYPPSSLYLNAGKKP